MSESVSNIQAWWNYLERIPLLDVLKYKLWTKKQYHSVLMGVQKDNKTLLDHIVELEAVIKLQKGAIAAKDKSSRQQIKKHTALEDRVRKEIEIVYSKGNQAWHKDRPDLTAIYNIVGEAFEKALLGKESDDE